MTSVMKGVRILEVAEYAMVPSAAAVLADWGAEVIKVEQIERGDPIRGVTAFGVAPGTGGFTYLWEPMNRGKRSIGLDLTHPDGQAIVHELAKQADVFLTNLLPGTRAKLRIDVPDIRAANPKIIYGRGSAHGPLGQEAARGGFDNLTYWFRTGAAIAAMPAGQEEIVTLPAPAFGDIQTGMAFAGGLAAALFHRERTGEGTVVDISLLSSGIWAMQAALVGVNVSGQTELQRTNHMSEPNPLNNIYRTADGRYLALAMFQSDGFWADFCRVVEADALLADPRFVDHGARAENHRPCIEALDAIFSAKSLAEWETILPRQKGQWSVVRVVSELNDDAQAWANGYLQRVDYGDGRVLTLASAPVQFDEAPPVLRPAPVHAQHTEEVLLELGRNWDQILDLKERGAIT